MKRTRGLGVVVATVALLLAVSFAAGAAKYEDGTYLGFSDADRRGYMMAIVTIENDQITAVILQEMQYTGLPKDESYPWPQFHEAMQVLPQRFIEANGPDIDGYTGATGTVNKAKQAVARALDKALVDKGPRKYQDGTFYGISTDREHSTGVAWVTIENDKIVKVEVDEFLGRRQLEGLAELPLAAGLRGHGRLRAAVRRGPGLADRHDQPGYRLRHQVHAGRAAGPGVRKAPVGS